MSSKNKFLTRKEAEKKILRPLAEACIEDIEKYTKTIFVVAGNILQAKNWAKEQGYGPFGTFNENGIRVIYINHPNTFLGKVKKDNEEIVFVGLGDENLHFHEIFLMAEIAGFVCKKY